MERKTLIMLAAFAIMCCTAKAQVVKYETFIYTSKDLPKEIQRVNKEQDADRTRRFGAGAISSAADAGKGIVSGYITSFIDMGVNAVASLVTSRARQKSEWLEEVQAENSWSTTIGNVDEMKDFYSIPSESGALDPEGMCFNGIGCLRQENGDTVFFVSCHIDRTKLNRIVNHSKFELTLDTLIISPTHSNLPNSSLDIDYSWKQRKDFNISMTMTITSSWFTDAIELHNNEQLGEFTITIPVSEKDLDANGYLRYVRGEDETSRYKVQGESFIIPRSYMGYRDNEGYHNIWGTGQYNLSIELKETCALTDEYQKDWRADRKQRNQMRKKKEADGDKQDVFSTIWQTVSSQKWDELGQQWIITTLSAPAGVISNDLIESLGLSTSSSSSTTTTTSL